MSASLGVVAALWRYPIKGVQGESLDKAEIGENGILGDRTYAIREFPSERFLGAKDQDYPWGEVHGDSEIIQLKAEYPEEPGRDHPRDLTIFAGNGSSLRSSDGRIDDFLSEVLHKPVHLVPFDQIVGEMRRSGRALHLMTTASLRKIRECYPGGDLDVRRFRPNLVIATPGERSGFLEEDWLGRTLAVGPQVRLRIEKPNKRCVVTAMRQGALSSDNQILATIAKNNRSNLGVMCSMISGGTVQVRDQVRMVL